MATPKKKPSANKKPRSAKAAGRKTPARKAVVAPKAAPAPAPKRLTAEAAPAERVNIPVEMPDFDTWGTNAKAFAKANPAALVVGVLAVILALLLLFP